MHKVTLVIILSLLIGAVPCFGNGQYDKTVKVTTFRAEIDSVLVDKLENEVIPWLNQHNCGWKDYLIVISMVSDVSVTISAVPFENLTYMSVNKSIMGIGQIENYTIILRGKYVTKFMTRGGKIKHIFRLYKPKNYACDAQYDWGIGLKTANLPMDFI